MNSDFIQPNKTNTASQIPVNDVSTPANDFSSSEPTNPVSETQPVSQPVVASEGSKKGHALLTTVLVLLALALGAAGVYYWQHQKVQNLRTSQAGLTTQVTSLQSQLAKAKADASAMPMTDTMASTTTAPDVVDVITVAPTSIAMDSATVSAQYSTKATEVWVESGTAPDKLTTVAKHVTPAKGTDTQTFSLTGLKMSTRYYYRSAAMVGGKTIDGGIVSFTTPAK